MRSLVGGARRVVSFMFTPRITFQPLARARFASAVRSAGVIVASAQDGWASLLDVQKLLSTWLPPMRMTEVPSVLRYWN